MVTVKIKIGNGAMPIQASEGASGYDIVYTGPDTYIRPQEFKFLPTGLRVEIPEGFEIQIRPRSGIAKKNGITVLNSPGTIDSDFRGEIGVILINHGNRNFTLIRGQKIAQMVLAEVPKVTFVVVDDLSDTDRGEGGFGSTDTQISLPFEDTPPVADEG